MAVIKQSFGSKPKTLLKSEAIMQKDDWKLDCTVAIPLQWYLLACKKNYKLWWTSWALIVYLHHIQRKQVKSAEKSIRSTTTHLEFKAAPFRKRNILYINFIPWVLYISTGNRPTSPNSFRSMCARKHILYFYSIFFFLNQALASLAWLV